MAYIQHWKTQTQPLNCIESSNKNRQELHLQIYICVKPHYSYAKIPAVIFKITFSNFSDLKLKLVFIDLNTTDKENITQSRRVFLNKHKIYCRISTSIRNSNLPFSIRPEFEIGQPLSHPANNLEGCVRHTGSVNSSYHSHCITENYSYDEGPLQTTRLQHDLKHVPGKKVCWIRIQKN